MNCKPGDLAIVIHDKHDIGGLGKLVEVLYTAPAETFQLPNGNWNVGAGSNVGKVWVIRLLGSPLKPPGCNFTTDYGTAHDYTLRPLKGDPVEEKRDEEITA